MKTAIIITTFNRPTETAKCFASIKNAKILPGTIFIIVDDHSTDEQTISLINDFSVPNCETILLRNAGNYRVCYSLKRGYDLAFNMRCDIVMNLDNDCLVNNFFQIELLKLKAIWQENIVTGFNCKTKNADGSERHIMTGGGDGYNYKKSVGGINMVLHKEQYEKYMLPALDYVINHNIGNWDHLTCMHSGQDGKKIVCLQPSVIQHQATKSSMGHLEQPDIADDFKGLTLPNVTLICIDDDLSKCYHAIEASTKDIKFGGNFKLLSHQYNKQYKDYFQHFIKIEPLGSKEAYSRFIMNELFNYVQTEFVLIVQHDGYPVNWQSWDNRFFDYHYIGAPWPAEYEPNRVGNGGFSLRSQKLCRITAGLNWGTTHPEDAVICRELRPMLEKDYGIKFAPLEIAEKFSYEGYMQPTAVFKDQFGFHNKGLAEQLKDGTFNEQYPAKPDAFQPNYLPKDFYKPFKPEGLIFNQFLGLGDILFLVPMARHYMSLGHDIVWPVADEYQPDLKRHFPDIQFVKKSSFPMDYERRNIYWHKWQYGIYKVLPLRWNVCNTPDCRDCMTGKYTAMGLDWKMWRELKWDNDIFKSNCLINRIAPELINHGQYELHCNDFGCEVTNGLKSTRNVGNTGLDIVKLKTIDGFSLLDWSLIIENAAIIHAVSSSTLYLFETLNLNAKEIHLYGRNQGMKDHVYVEALRTKNYILHE